MIFQLRKSANCANLSIVQWGALSWQISCCICQNVKRKVSQIRTCSLRKDQSIRERQTARMRAPIMQMRGPAATPPPQPSRSGFAPAPALCRA